MKEKNTFSYACYRVFLFFVRLFYPKTAIEGLENLPSEACIVVGNHTQMNGPICGEIYFPVKRKIWCAYQMMYLKEVPQYAFTDFWSQKPKGVHWFYKLLSYLIAPISVCVFSNAHTIPVFRDNRLLSTFKQTVSALADDTNVIVFPECYEPHNNIVYQFQNKFVDVAKLYYKHTGKEVSFVPLYIAPALKKMYLGKPIQFNPDAPIEDERHRICAYLMDAITEIAVSLPRHRVVPYPNLPKKDYPFNKTDEDIKNEKTCG